tara:strand:+ start:1797 stop:2132 length:336 start_codon:yes stop_codon:yes gene_type:complete
MYFSEKVSAYKSLFNVPIKRQLQVFILTLLGGISLGGDFSYAQTTETKQLREKREVHNIFSDQNDKGSIFEATNPLDLMNRLKKASAMDSATAPSDAIDDALKAFDSEIAE